MRGMRGFSRPGDLGPLRGDLATSGLDFGDLVFFFNFMTWRPDPFFYVFSCDLRPQGLIICDLATWGGLIKK